MSSDKKFSHSDVFQISEKLEFLTLEKEVLGENIKLGFCSNDDFVLLDDLEIKIYDLNVQLSKARDYVSSKEDNFDRLALENENDLDFGIY